jgi:hypothetical protein
MATRTEAKFKVGQIVVMTDRKQTPFRILAAIWNDGWFYKWSRSNAASERMIRELTPHEKGDGE